jgi:ABC-type transporter Mla subunit MlaD
MINLITLLFGNPILIVLIGLILLTIEIFAVINYSQKDCKMITSFLTYLEENQNLNLISLDDCEQKQKGLFTYLLKHLDGNNLGKEFQVKKKNNSFQLFTYPTILTNSIPNSPVYFAPTLLTALGILGTFLGIFLGLQKIGIGNIEQTEDLLEASTMLLSGMKTAFSTSLAGLGSASIMMIVLAIGRKLRQEQRNQLRKRLSDIAFLESPQQLLSRLDNSSMGQVADSLKLMSDSLSNLSPDNIAFAIQKAIASDDSILIQQLQQQTDYLANFTPKAIVSHLQPLITPIQTELSNFRQIHHQQQSNLELQIKKIATELIAPVVVRLDETAQVTTEASTAVTQLKNELGNICQNLAQTAKTINQFQEDTIFQLQDFANTSQATLKQFNQDTKEVLTTVAVEMKQAVAESITAMENQKEAFNESAKITSTIFKQIREDLQFALTTQATLQREMLQDVVTSTKQVLQQAKEAFQKQGETIHQAMTESVQGMEKQREAFEQSTNQAAMTFQGIREELQQALITQASQQKEMLDKVQLSTEHVLEKANQAFRQQTDTLQQVGKEASRLLNQSKENLLETLMNIDDILDKTRVTLQEELETFRLEYQNSLNQFFVEQNNLLEDTLGKQKEGLNVVVHDLKMTFQEEAKTRAKLTEEVNENLTNIQTTTKTVSELVKETGINSSQRLEQLKELANNSNKQVEQIEKSYQEMNNQFDHQLTKMNDYFESILKQIITEFNQLSEQTNQQISEYLSNAHHSYSESFEQADSAMANICSQLNNTSNGLMNVAEYLVAAANDLKLNS